MEMDPAPQSLLDDSYTIYIRLSVSSILSIYDHVIFNPVIFSLLSFLISNARNKFTMDPMAHLSRDSSNDENLKGSAIHDELPTRESIDDSIETTDPGKAVWLIACTVSMGGFLFGACE
jgi:hypothetical protein